MPIYCFKCECGKQTSQARAMKDSDRPMQCECGKPMSRDFIAEHSDIGHIAGTWPMYSDAAGVAPEQVKEAMQHSHSIGIPTDFTPDGRAVFTSRLHRKRYCEAIGLRDRNGGYSDPGRN